MFTSPQHCLNLHDNTFIKLRHPQRDIQLQNVSHIRFELWGLFVNILTADDKYSSHNKDNLKEPTQMELSEKQKLFFKFFIAFLKFIKF